jgi:hypothetical protein
MVAQGGEGAVRVMVFFRVPKDWEVDLGVLEISLFQSRQKTSIKMLF